MSARDKFKRNWVIALFGLPFFCVGAGFLIFWIAPNIYDGWRMASWPETEGILLRAELKSSRSDDSTTYSTEARYRYVVEGRSYQNDRVAIGSGSDNIGDFQKKLGRALEQAFQDGRGVSVWYNPENPAEAVLNRDMRWGLLGFAFVFVVTFGGAGAGCLYYGLRKEQAEPARAHSVQPWLQRADWRSGVIQSGAKSGMYFVWIFAGIWNLVSLPLAFFVPEIWREQGAVALIGLVFPLIGMVLIFWAVKVTLEWKRFGATPLTLDPFPGAIGGDVGGEISVQMPYNPGVVFEVVLSCVSSYTTGSGKNRSRHETIVWQDRGYAVVEPAMRDINLKFRFEVPDELPESEPYGSSYHLWRLAVQGEMAGADLDRSFEIPVYRTAEKSKHIAALSPRRQAFGVTGASAETLLPLEMSDGGVSLHYTMLRNWGSALGSLLFGAVFAGIGRGILQFGADGDFMFTIMGNIFLFVGGVILMTGLYGLFNALQVRFDGRSVSAVRTVLGIPINSKTAAYREITAIQIEKGGSSQSGSLHRMDYRVVAKTAARDIVLAEGLDSYSKAETVLDYFEKLTGVEHNVIDMTSKNSSL